MRALFLSTNTAVAAYVRYRILQYFPHLRRHGIEPEHRALFDEPLDRVIYRPGRRLEKVTRLLARSLSRLGHVAAARRYDVVFIAREAFLVGPPLLEALVRATGRPIVFDMDDAVWEGYDSPTYGKLARWVKCAWKTDPIVRMADAVTCGNTYVAGYARERARRVELLPTVVDTDRYRPAEAPASRVPVLGWIGSHSTTQYLLPLVPTLERLAETRRFKLRVVGADRPIVARGVEVDNVAWTEAREIDEVRGFDIGLFPVVEDAWSRGKSGFKAVQYGAVGIPTVASPVTTNCEIVADGQTGLLADRPEAWHDALATLIDDAPLRRRLGEAARARITARYSLAVHAPRLADLLKSLA